ncbi:MAG: hypothetical protein F6J87_12140 [Spirulina sp. SIO3F2]|nr:hypothetical protein [Spirulina sp. SIO3F2]
MSNSGSGNRSSKPKQTRNVPRPILKKKSKPRPKLKPKSSPPSEPPQFEVDVIIAEKPRISGAIARALVKKDTVENFLHSDIILVNESGQESQEKVSDLPVYLRKDINERFSFKSLHVDHQGKTHAEKVRRRRRIDETLKSNVSEELSYYILPYENKIIIIFDTQGNPLTYSLPKGKGKTHINLLKLIALSENWSDLSEHLSLQSSFRKRKLSFRDRDASYSDESESYVARALWFEYVLAQQRLPCKYQKYREGTPFTIARMIAATDEDIAGSYIFLSIFQLANQVAQKEGIPEITPDKVKRLDMMSLEPEVIRKSLSNLKEFEWDMAFAGKNRADFDFIFGTTMTTWFKSIWRDDISEHNKSEHIPVSIGRNRCLGLRELIKLEIEAQERIRENEIQNYLFLIIPGLVGWYEMVECIKKRAYTSLHIEMIQDGVTPANLLLRCRESGVGTHTTRYKVPSQLKSLGLAKDHSDDQLVSTAYGRSYDNLLYEYLDPSENVGLSIWSMMLYERIKNAKKVNLEDIIPLERAQENYDYFMNQFFPAFREYIDLLQSKGSDISQTIKQLRNLHYHVQHEVQLTLSQDSDSLSIDKPFKNITYNAGSVLLRGYESCLPEQEIINLFNGTSKISKIQRVIPPVDIDIRGCIRRVCVIPPEFNFGVKKIYNPSLLLDLDLKKSTVFRASLEGFKNLNEIPLSQESGLQVRLLSNCKPLNLDCFDDSEINVHSPHKPLMMTSISRSDISGPLGLKIVQEYNNPWISTIDKLRRNQNGGINVERFDADELKFQKVDWYSYGKVHNFESLLLIMFNKYGIPFHKTASMAQELYLNVD